MRGKLHIPAVLLSSHSVTDSADRDLGRDLVDFAVKYKTATWSIQYLDHMYDDPSQPRSNASRLSGLVLYFCKRGATDQGHDVSVTFVSILGVCVFPVDLRAGVDRSPIALIDFL